MNHHLLHLNYFWKKNWCWFISCLIVYIYISEDNSELTNTLTAQLTISMHGAWLPPGILLLGDGLNDWVQLFLNTKILCVLLICVLVLIKTVPQSSHLLKLAISEITSACCMAIEIHENIRIKLLTYCKGTTHQLKGYNK